MSENAKTFGPALGFFPRCSLRTNGHSFQMIVFSAHLLLTRVTRYCASKTLQTLSSTWYHMYADHSDVACQMATLDTPLHQRTQ